MTTDRLRLPGLDGLRAIAVLLVIVHHLCSQGMLASFPALARTLQQGSFGVQVFFVLSVFLITWLLVREEQRAGSIDIRRFYFRRALRILPPAFFYLAFVLLLTVVGILDVGRRDFAYSFFFVRNAYGVGGSHEVSHFWSLGLEEQFYLTWPFLLVLVHGRLRLGVSSVLLLLLAGWRATGVGHFGNTAAGAEALLLGCTLAQVRQRYPAALTFATPLVRGAAVVGASIAIAIAVFSAVPAMLSSGIAQSIAVIGVAVIINAVVDGPVTLVSSLLNAAPVQWIGRLSYSLYLWQQLFCWSRWSGPNAADAWPLLIAASFVCAAFSYYVIERPALSLRDRLEQAHSHPSPAPAISLAS